jgi:chromosome segregation ATPase
MKAQLAAFFRGLPLTVYLVVGVVAAAGGWLAINNAYQRQQGAFEEKLKVVRAASDSSMSILTKRNHALDALVADAVATAARYQASKHAADVQASKLKTARDSLAQAVADSLATIEDLRGKAARMIAASDLTEAARAVERVRADSTLKAQKKALTFSVDSVRAAGKDALDKMRTRAETAERAGVTVSKGWRAVLLGRCGVIAGVGGVRSGNQLYAGPGVMAGCKVFPW